MDGYFNQKFPKISEMSAKVPQNLAKFLKSIPTKLLLGKVPKCVLFGGIITAFVFQPYPLAKNKHYLPCTGRKSQFLGAMKIFRRAPPFFARGGTGVIKKKLCSHLYESPGNYGREMKQCMKGTDATPNILKKLKRRKSLKKILIYGITAHW